MQDGYELNLMAKMHKVDLVQMHILLLPLVAVAVEKGNAGKIEESGNQYYKVMTMGVTTRTESHLLRRSVTISVTKRPQI
jgi:hypothetical protein